LAKPARLTEAEWAVMQTHSQIGHDILARSQAPVFQLAAEIALSHHERWDGSGYPQGLAGHDIPESARIVAVADVFDALTMTRPYKEAWPLERVLQTLRDGAGRHFEPELVALFFAIQPQILEIQRKWE
jgi:putative two-component system response regulator